MTPFQWRITALALLLLVGLYGCAEDGSCMAQCGDGVVDPFEECDDGNTLPDDGCAPDCTIEVNQTLPPTLAAIQATIFNPICSICHTDGGAYPLMQLSDEATSYANLVGIPDTFCPTVPNRVESGAPDSSCIVLKIEGSPDILNQRMPPPPSYAPLPPAQIDQIRQWIEDGANP